MDHVTGQFTTTGLDTIHQSVVISITIPSVCFVIDFLCLSFIIYKTIINNLFLKRKKEENKAYNFDSVNYVLNKIFLN